MELSTGLAKLDKLTAPFEVKALGDGTTLELRGWATTYDTVDFQGDTFDRATTESAFRKYMETNPQVVLNHSLAAPLGRITEAIYSSKGIEVVALIPMPAPSAPAVLRQTWAALRSGLLNAFSIGGRWSKLAAAGSQKLFPEQIIETSVAIIGGVNPDATFAVVGTKAVTLDAELQRLSSLSTGTLDRALAKLASL